jgi:WD40 repeat protein
MDYKQKYLKYKQKYLKLLRVQKGGQPFLMDILAGQVFSYLFERNQRILQLIYTGKQSVPMQPLEKFTLNHKYRLKLLAGSGLSVLLARRLIEGFQNNGLGLAKRILSRTHKLPKISPPTLAVTLNKRNGMHTDIIWSFTFHPTLPFFATGSRDKTAKLFRFLPDGSKATCVATLVGHSRSIMSVAFHTNLPFLATGSYDESVKLWRLDNLDVSKVGATCVATLGSDRGGRGNCINSVAFHPEVPILVAGGDDGTVKLWRLVYTPDGSTIEATCVATLDSHNGGHDDSVRSVNFHPTLKILATCSIDHTAKLWSFSSDGSIVTCVATLTGHSKPIISAAFHSTLPFLATGSSDQTAKLWRLVYTPDDSISTATCVATLEEHKSYVYSVSFHSTLPILSTGSNDNTVKLWSFSPNGLKVKSNCIATMDKDNGGHKKAVHSIMFHPSLPLLATCSEDYFVKLWKL